MGRRKRVGVDEQVPILFTLDDRDAILEHTMVSPDTTRRLKIAPLQGSKLRVGLTLAEIDELCGVVASVANNTEDLRLESRLDRVFGKLKECEDRYED